MSVDQLPTAREQLHRLVAGGMSDAAIGRTLGVSTRTVLRWRQREQLASRWVPEQAPHGTVARYRRCHCDECRAANAAAQRAYLARLSGGVPTTDRTRRRWTAGEDAVLLANDGTLAQRAMRLGRSYAAAKRRLERLRLRPP